MMQPTVNVAGVRGLDFPPMRSPVPTTVVDLQKLITRLTTTGTDWGVAPIMCQGLLSPGGALNCVRCRAPPRDAFPTDSGVKAASPARPQIKVGSRFVGVTCRAPNLLRDRSKATTTGQSATPQQMPFAGPCLASTVAVAPPEFSLAYGLPCYKAPEPLTYLYRHVFRMAKITSLKFGKPASEKERHFSGGHP